MLAVGLLTVGTSVPVNAILVGADQASPPSSAVASAPTAADETTAPRLQSVTVDALAVPIEPTRDGFTVLSYQEQLRAQYGQMQELTFTPTTGAVRWPFPYAVPISDYWGPRVAPCDGCSTFHKGVDFTPGSGAPIYAIADGVVTLHDDTYGGLGNNVWIDHVINGEKITSVYAHMISGSSSLAVGDVVRVGDYIGQVGDTGSSTGAHLHFEIHVDKIPVDPFAWLTANAVN